ncbi:MAG: S41 family peptidase [Longimicrobiales bacterium]
MMIRRSAIAVLCFSFAAAWAPLGAQQTDSATGEAAEHGTLSSQEAQVFLQAFQTISRYHALAQEDSTLWEGAIEGLLENLNDPYASVFTPDEYGEFQEDNTGDYAGIGVQITHLGGRVTVTAVFRETPAERVGMLVGDQIVWVEGVDATEWTTDDARDAIRGEPGSEVSLQVARQGFEEPIPMNIERDSVHVSAVATATLPGEIGHIALDRVARGSTEEMAEALVEFRDARAVIIDLRRNPGGYLDEALQITDLFLPPGSTLASAEARSADGELQSQSWQARTPMAAPDKPIVVLVDRFTASAAEIVTGALQDYGLAVVLGERSFGKGVVQTVYPLPAGRQLRITTGSWYTPLGRSLQRARDRAGVPLPEDDLAAAVVTATNGRELQSGGGIFPDLAVADDTLKTEERGLLANAADAGVPMLIRLEEFTFDLAKAALDRGVVERLPASAFDPLAAQLIEEGMDPAVVNDPLARSYLDWRAQIRYLTRAEERGLALEVQAERDRVLAEALVLAGAARTPDDLFASVDGRVTAPPGGAR